MSEAIQCFVRVRPSLGQTFGSSWTVDGNTISRGLDKYTFERVFDVMVQTEEVFDSCTQIVDGAMQGVNGSLMAYGQSGSGKTFTLTGSKFTDGIVQLALRRIFDKISETNRTYALRMSICEVYNEKIFDLIGKGEDLAIRENGSGSIQIEGLTEIPLINLVGAEELINTSIKGRTTGETARNERSSRSHVLYMVQMESRSCGSNRSLSSSLCIVDLAGSENALLSQGVRLNEGKFINKSLLALCKIMTQLSEKQPHIAYRESKLTRLLKPSLAGNSRIAIVATVDGAATTETASTLKFARCAVKVTVAPKVNENVEEEGILATYMRQIDELKNQLKGKEEAESRREESAKKLEELMRVVLVGGEVKAEPNRNKKNRRMTWAPGRGTQDTGPFSPLSSFPPVKRMKSVVVDEDKIEEEDDACSLTTHQLDVRLSMGSMSSGGTMESIQTGIAVDTVSKHVQTDHPIYVHFGVNTEGEEAEEKAKEEWKRIKEEMKSIELKAEILRKEEEKMRREEKKRREFEEMLERTKSDIEEEKRRVEGERQMLDKMSKRIREEEEGLSVMKKWIDEERKQLDERRGQEILNYDGEVKRLREELSECERKTEKKEEEFAQLREEMKVLEATIRAKTVQEIKGKVEGRMKSMMEEIEQLKKENISKDNRIECLIKAEQSMLMPSLDLDEVERKQKEYITTIRDKEAQLAERDEYIARMTKKEEGFKKRMAEAEKKIADMGQTAEERIQQIHRYRSEITRVSNASKEEAALRETKWKAELEKEREKQKRLEGKLEGVERDLARKMVEKKSLEETAEQRRLKTIALTNELRIEKERRLRIGEPVATQTDSTVADSNRLEEETEKVRKEFADYREKMEILEKEGRRLAESTVKYWKERAKTAESAAKKRKQPLSRIENNTTD